MEHVWRDLKMVPIQISQEGVERRTGKHSKNSGFKVLKETKGCW